MYEITSGKDIANSMELNNMVKHLKFLGTS